MQTIKSLAADLAAAIRVYNETKRGEQSKDAHQRITTIEDAISR